MKEKQFNLTFWGVRGGYPKPGPSTIKYGGNTTCIEINADQHRIMIDAGTGAIGLGQKIIEEHLASGDPINLILLLTHTHHDHTQGLPFFFPTRHPASTIHIFGPHLGDNQFEDILRREMSPPVFPLGLEELYSKRTLSYIRHGDLIVLNNNDPSPTLYSLGEYPEDLDPEAVIIRANHGYNHPQHGIFFFRVEYGGHSLVIATDTEGYVGGDRKLIALAKEADLLVHDAEYDSHEYADDTPVRQGFGHSTWNMAVEVAQAAAVKKLVLTHHSPGHDDAYLEQMLAKTQEHFPNTILAKEGETLHILSS